MGLYEIRITKNEWRRKGGVRISSAQQFLIEAIENHNDGKHNFAIVHAVTAAELLLKERLARIHPALIFRNVDAPTFQAEQTISLVKLPQRLSNFGVTSHGTYRSLGSYLIKNIPNFYPNENYTVARFTLSTNELSINSRFGVVPMHQDGILAILLAE
jgi:hypothetical protein